MKELFVKGQNSILDSNFPLDTMTEMTCKEVWSSENASEAFSGYSQHIVVSNVWPKINFLFFYTASLDTFQHSIKLKQSRNVIRWQQITTVFERTALLGYSCRCCCLLIANASWTIQCFLVIHVFLYFL